MNKRAEIGKKMARARVRNFTIHRLRVSYGNILEIRDNPETLALDKGGQDLIVAEAKKSLASLDGLLYALGTERESQRLENLENLKGESPHANA